MKSKIYCFALIGLLLWHFESFSQQSENPKPAYSSFKISSYFLINGGCSLSGSFGYWKTFKYAQPAINVSVNLLYGRNHLGNRDRYKSNWQLNTVISPILTFKMPPYATDKHGIYEEINPFYLGNSSSIYCNYRSSFTLGTSFVTMPKGKGKNIATSRNRSQQLVFINLRIGAKKQADSVRNFSFNLYEDFLGTDNAVGQAFADNWDRYYTGGGNLQYRFNNNYKFKVFSEIYTGTATRDGFDNPDIVFYQTEEDKKKKNNRENEFGNNNKFVKFFWGPVRDARYAAQESGQKKLNSGRFLAALEYTPTANSNYQHDFFLRKRYDFYAGTQGGNLGMWVQNMIHSSVKIDKVLASDPAPEELHRKKTQLDRYHRFMPNMRIIRPVFGVGMNYANLNP